ncbi:MAG: DUF1570 domain-containing protein [Candidatus Omnitrophica bacterium]|nr:DUF1570 domain-containing protein [Candidatus Omnitrophota bacterium]
MKKTTPLFSRTQPYLCRALFFLLFLLSALCCCLFGNHSAYGSDDDIRDQLIEELKKQENLDRVLLLDGRIFQGEVDVDGETVSVKEQFGHSGYLSTSFHRDEIADITFARPIDYTVTAEEIAIKREFPDFHIMKRERYTFFTSEDFFFIERVVYALEELANGVCEEFDAFFTDNGRTGVRCYVVVLSSRDVYREYVRRYAPALEYSSGHYDFQRSRLVLFNQFGGEDYAGFQEEVRKQEGELDRLETRLKKSDKLNTLYKKRMQKKIQGARRQTKALSVRTSLQMRGRTIQLIRHEGAHQLFHASGLHQTSLAKRPWFLEGLACFCETPATGGINRRRLEVVQRAIEDGQTIPLAVLLDDVRNERDVLSLGEGGIELFYAQSWSFAYFLMNAHKEAFFQFIRRINQRAWPWDFFWEEPHRALLAKTLGTSSEELETEWLYFVAAL